ncbi:hypothetical protein K2173_024800 [Erythroxylum novogranatense]|uniref:Uncharacterized protein n=1 Tax=Erythroxylum novogranatense TaxID=1862640 RepID=A0AAV8UC71_9ROSI|nr:hypothetical protein K2173_024800 [Erythroxylum novogranatense]
MDVGPEHFRCAQGHFSSSFAPVLTPSVRRIAIDSVLQVLIEESKEADKTRGQATHRISRGIHDKGHSVTRKLNAEGKADTVQTLHNLDEDELTGFEATWNGNVKADRSDSGPSAGRAKKVVRINIE